MDVCNSEDFIFSKEIIDQIWNSSDHTDWCYRSLNHQQQTHVRRIVDIEEPAVHFFVSDITAPSVIHPDRYECKKCSILKPAKINQ